MLLIAKNVSTPTSNLVKKIIACRGFVAGETFSCAWGLHGQASPATKFFIAKLLSLEGLLCNKILISFYLLSNNIGQSNNRPQNVSNPRQNNQARCKAHRNSIEDLIQLFQIPKTSKLQRLNELRKSSFSPLIKIFCFERISLHF